MNANASDVLSRADEHGIDLPDLSDRHDPEQLTVGMVLATSDAPRFAELVEITKVTPPEDGDDHDAWIVGLDFVEREGPDGDGYEYETTFASLMARSEADGGWVEVPHTATTGTARCPSCGSFLNVHDARAPFGHTDVTDPFASGGCDQCGHHVDHDFLADAGVAVELLL